MPAGTRNFLFIMYAPDQLKYESSKIVAVYVVGTVGIAPGCCKDLQVDLPVLCVTFLTYNNTNNTYKYTVFLIEKDTT